ncbi:MAG: DUF2207 domain-containing protein [Chloroflexota bacterium]|nr:DUF2207 domain-containing protein [Chloroflexota bacterium]
MMPSKVSYTLLALILGGLVIFGAVETVEYVTAEHDGWDIFAPVSVTTDPLVVDPRNLLAREDREVIARLVREARDYGVPWSVQVVQRRAEAATTSAQELAEQQYAEQPVETVEDAEDGLLMLVSVPAGDPTGTEIAFAAGRNFYPHGDLTPEQLGEMVDTQAAQAIEENRIGDAVIEAATWVQWMHLFGGAPEEPATPLERGVQELLQPLGAAGLAALALIVFSAAAAIALITRIGVSTTTALPELDGVLAGAIERGRVDRPVVAGSVLDTIDRGVLAVTPDGAVVPGAVQPATERDRLILDAIGERATNLRGLLLALDRRDALARSMEDQLAAAGAFHPKSPILTLWLRWIAVGGLALGVLAVVVSVLGSARYALAAALTLVVIALVVAIWNERRSWVTRSGARAVARWRDLHTDGEDRQRAIFETIIGMEPMSATRDDNAPMSPAVWQVLPDIH